MRYFIQLSYKGTRFHGWQIQANAATVQEILEKALGTVLHEKLPLVGCGRTDTGVHAEKFYAHFDTNQIVENPKQLIFKLNSFLPKDIAIQDLFRVSDEMHSRFSALSRTYQYRIATRPNPFLTEFSYYHYGKLNIEQMNRAAVILFEYQDFTSFSKLHSDTKTNICKIIEAGWNENENLLQFTITADRFLRNMVRAITGTMLEIGLEKIDLNQFRKIIESKNRSNAGFSVPACGLFLSNIEYSAFFTQSKDINCI
jgi:tRNA pseudouridine38-40 synthase